MDQSRSVLLLRSAKAREFEELWRDKCTHAPWTFHLNWPGPVLSADQTGQMESDLSRVKPSFHMIAHDRRIAGITEALDRSLSLTIVRLLNLSVSI